MAPAAPLLEIDRLHVRYGNVEALHGISLSVNRGEIVTILGANGAGKSTTLRAISGLLKPSAGEIRLEGRPAHAIPAHERVRLGIAQSPEGRRIFGTLTVRENLGLGAFTRKDGAEIAETTAWIYRLFPVLEKRRDQLAGTLSGGEQQMLAMGRALMGAPRLLMLDEPSLGLAPIIVADIFRIITELRASGVSVLLVEQNAQAALKIADHAYVMELGEFVLSGKASDIAANERVAASYLGFQHEGASAQ